MKHLLLVVAVAACNSESNPPGSVGFVVSTEVEVTEGSAALLSVALDQAPAAAFAVQVVANGDVTVSPSTLEFTAETFNTPQSVTISSAHDVDLVDGTGSVQLIGDRNANVTVTVAVRDDDSQAIVVRDSMVTIGEGDSTMVGISMAFAPADAVTVAVASLNPALASATPSTLTFTPASYDTPQLVTVAGAEDMNLTNETTKLELSTMNESVDVPIEVIDNDQQQIVLSTSAVTVPEGGNSAVELSLAFEPSGPVNVSFSSDNGAIPVFPSSHTYMFSPNDYMTGRTITVANGVDRNAIDEVATISLVESTTNAMATFTATVDDVIARQYYGWPTNFVNYAQLEPESLIALQITNVDPYTLDRFGHISSSGNAWWRAALYTDDNGAPGTLVVGTSIGTQNVGVNQIVIAPVALSTGTYWIALRVNHGTLIKESTGAVTAQTCVRTVDTSTFTDPWPTTFGPATCTTAPARNLYIDTLY